VKSVIDDDSYKQALRDVAAWLVERRLALIAFPPRVEGTYADGAEAAYKNAALTIEMWLEEWQTDSSV